MTEGWNDARVGRGVVSPVFHYSLIPILRSSTPIHRCSITPALFLPTVGGEGVEPVAAVLLALQALDQSCQRGASAFPTCKSLMACPRCGKGSALDMLARAE